ncbi:unnamed protein product [Moneuplotes crassus]|uniref:chitin synthase n=1 Tax=Euplotes crassus TaxID=5936 RepID=A0AAD1UNR5_EUPCR|nr:unnamed protein product [Moneuplotes crassus]
MALNTLSGLLLVGLYYATYSIFLRSVFPDSVCFDITKTANILENVYLALVFLVLILSTCVKLDWCDWYFKIAAIFMGIFSILMTVVVIISVMQVQINAKVYIATLGLLCTYILPMLLNIRNLKFLNFWKGTFYLFLLMPTYINIISIYAVANTHDVTWGSRAPPNSQHKETSRERKQRVEYENFRSNWLVFWIFLNILAGWSVIFISREDQTEYLFYVVAAIGAIVGSKLFFSILYKVMYLCVHKRLKRKIHNQKKEHGYQFDLEEKKEDRSNDSASQKFHNLWRTSHAGFPPASYDSEGQLRVDSSEPLGFFEGKVDSDASENVRESSEDGGMREERMGRGGLDMPLEKVERRKERCDFRDESERRCERGISGELENRQFGHSSEEDL